MTMKRPAWIFVALCVIIGCSKRDDSQARAFENARGALWDKADDLMTAIYYAPDGMMGAIPTPNDDADTKNLAAAVKVAAASHEVVIAARNVPHIHADGDLAACVASTLDAVSLFEKSLGPIAKEYESDPHDGSLTGTLQDDEFRRALCNFLEDHACSAALHTPHPKNVACR